jgi:hypothetical protein
MFANFAKLSAAEIIVTLAAIGIWLAVWAQCASY